MVDAIEAPLELKAADRDWRPILTSTTRRNARAAVDAIAASLRRLRPRSRAQAEDLSLMSGDTGLALLHCCLARRSPEAQAFARRCVAKLAGTVARRPLDDQVSLYAGAAGCGCVLSIAGRMLATEIPFDHARLEREIARRARLPRAAEYDLTTGVVGAAVYALERLPDDGAVECLERIVERLARTAESSGRLVAWRTPKTRIVRSYPEGLDDRRYAVGVAHGICGIVTVLASIHAAGIARRTMGRLVEGGVAWLLERRGSAPGRCFPAEIDSRGRAAPTGRLGWCWGDSGIEAALLVAARAFDRDDWVRDALAIATSAASVHPYDAGVTDGGLCHGTAGLGHLFNRMCQETGDPELLDTARFWFRQTLRIRRPGRGIGGFFASLPTRILEDGSLTGWHDVRDPGFLGGSAGIALALHAAIESAEPPWDKALLCA